MMPTHWIRNHIPTISGEEEVPLNDSVEKTITRQNMIHAKDLATRSFKLKDNPYNKSEKARMAIPAVRIWLIVRIIETRPSIQSNTFVLYSPKQFRVKKSGLPIFEILIQITTKSISHFLGQGDRAFILDLNFKITL